MRRQVVDLYEATPGVIARGIAQDLGLCRGMLREWLHRRGTGWKTGLNGAPAPSPRKPKTDRADSPETPSIRQTP